MDFNFWNYEAFHMIRQNNKAGGVASYIKNSLQFKIIKDKSLKVDDLLECITVELNIGKDKHIQVSCTMYI